MSAALELTDSTDLTFLKDVIYRYREDKSSVNLKITHGAGPKRGRRAPVNGFLALWRGGDEPEPHVCTSVGGVALASYYDEATRATGSAAALATLNRAMAPVLAAG